MKKAILFFIGLFAMHLLYAQVSMSVGSGAYFVVGGGAQVVMDTGSLVNNGIYMDSTGVFKATGGVAFSGSGTTHFNNFNINNSQTTNVNTLVSVYNTAALTAGKLNANNNLYIRSDNNTTANMVVTGILNNTVKGIIPRASVTSSTGCTPYTSNLTLNISGPAVVYQWQSSPDSSAWSNVSGATNATYTASVTATIWYRCNLSANNSAYSQSTPGVKLVLSGSLPAITGTAVVCASATTTLSNTVSGGTWSSGTTSVATISSSSGVVTGVAAGTSVITYAASSGCSATRIVTVNPLPAAITGTTSICVGATTVLSSATGGGVSWISGNTSVATIGSMSGVVTGLASGTTGITYTISTGCSVKTIVTVNSLPGAITGSMSLCSGTTSTVSSSPAGGTWASSNTAVATIGSTGTISAIAAGTTAISYTLATGCRSIATATVGATPAVITGTPSLCVGGVTTLASATPGCTWSSNTTSVATIGSTGIVTGISTGTTTISYTHSNGCARTTIVTVDAGLAANTGTPTVCMGSTTTLSNATFGGTWSSSVTAKATVNSTTGVVTGVAAGTSNITYTAGSGCYSITQVTVGATLANITGGTNVCVGLTTTFSHAVSGGVWTSSSTSLATVGSATGIITGVSAGTPNITYTVGSCYKTKSITVNGGNAAISGNTTICVGSTSVLSCATPGGTAWTSSNTSVATIGSGSGVVTGLTSGTTDITYAATTGCTSTTVVTVLALPTAISGTLTVCQGATTALASVGTTGGTWASSTPSKATVGSVSGVVTGVAGGTSTITYTWTNTCRRTAVATVNPLPAAAAIVGAGTMSPTTAPTQTLTASQPGGTWISATPARATIVAGTGFMTAISAGTVVISYTQTNGCGTLTNTRIFTIVSPRPSAPIINGSDIKFAVYPNPTSGTLTVMAPVTGVFTIYTIDGKEIELYEIREATTNILLPNSLATGIYTCRFTGDDGSTIVVSMVLER